MKVTIIPPLQEGVITPDPDIETLKRVVAKIKDLHRPYAIYDPCNHTHKEDDPGVIEAEDVGLVCKDGKQVDICRTCCTDSHGFQAEECWVHHVHTNGFLCPTNSILDNTENPNPQNPGSGVDT